MPQLPQRSNEQFVVALDIGTENVKALIAKVKGEKIEIIGTGKAHQSLSDMQAGAISDIESVTANCDSALAEAEEQAGISGYQVVIGIAGELVKGSTNTVRVRRKDAKKPLDEEEIQKIISLVQERALVKAKKQLALELGGKEVEVRLVNSALVKLQIDGYDITNPLGFQGGEVTVQLYTAFAPMIHIGALERVAQMLDLELVAVAAEPYAVARAVVGDEDSKVSAILMDIGGGTTDIAVVHEGGVEGTQMFGIGGRAFTKSIEKNLSITYAQAEAVKLGLSEGKVPQQKVSAVQDALSKTLSVWINGVELALEEFTVDTMPQEILLCGGGASLDMLVKVLEGASWRKQLPFTKAPKVRRIRPSEILSINDTTGSLEDHTFITAMGLLRVGSDTLGTTGLGGKKNGVKDKFNKLLRV